MIQDAEEQMLENRIRREITGRKYFIKLKNTSPC
jgi:hypothetical protein